MGRLVTARCNLCGGHGDVIVESLTGLLLYEWVEGVLDSDTDEKWLRDQMERILRSRAEKKKAASGSS
jgi:hypothetical protein